MFWETDDQRSELVMIEHFDWQKAELAIPRPARVASLEVIAEDTSSVQADQKKSALPKNHSEASLSSPNFTWNILQGIFDGEKYPGGLGKKLDFYYIDYWTLRRRSYKLFTENRYCLGLIHRMLTNEIHKGLILEAAPDANILDFTTEELNKWSDDVESKFSIWENNKELVSWDKQRTFGQLQRDVRKISLLSGDVLIVLRQHPDTNTPVIQLVDGYDIRTPEKNTVNKNQIKNGVEVDSRGTHIAFWVRDASDPFNIKFKRIPAAGEKTGRRVAWLVYGHKIRVNDTRGMPALGIIIQSLKELDRYSDAEQRAAVLNAIMSLWIKKGSDKPLGKGFTGGAQTYASVGQNTADETTVTREFNIAGHLPGVVLDRLGTNDEVKSFDAARPNVNYRAYEESLMASFAWSVAEMPPNIYRLAFSSNYSASGAEINEYKLYLDFKRGDFATDLPKPYYVEWLLSMVLNDDITAPGLLDTWRDKSKWLKQGAWFQSEWGGAIKPSLRLIQDIKAYVEAIKNGLMTRDMATKFLWSRKYTTIIRRLIKENEDYVVGIQPLIDAGLVSVQAESESSASTLKKIDNKRKNLTLDVA